MRRHEKPFTLVELLVVMGIIMILAGMLLPALGKAKDKAHTLTCTGQVRQIGFAGVMYAQENDHLLPIGRGHNENHWYRRWYSYMPHPDVWECPAYGRTTDRPISGQDAQNRVMAKVEYGTICDEAVRTIGARTGAGYSAGDCYYIKLLDVRKVARRCLLACYPNQLRLCPVEHANSRPTPQCMDVGAALREPKFPRHPGVIPCGFADGHVKALTVEEGDLRRDHSTVMWMRQ